VTVVIDGKTFTAIVDENGKWSVDVAPALTDGVYEFTASITDEAGNTSTATGTLTLNTQAPIVRVSQPDDIEIITDPTNGARTIEITLPAPATQIATFEAESDVNWSITGGDDASRFDINQNGKLRYLTPESNQRQLFVHVTATDVYRNTTEIRVNLNLTWPVVESCIDNSQIPGSTIMYVNCKPLEYIYAERDNNTVAVFSSDESVDMALTALDGTGEPLAIINGRIRLKREGSILVQGFGMMPGTYVNAWLFSDPLYLGAAFVQPDSTFREAMLIGDALAPGEHTLIVRGVTFRGDTLTLSVGVFLDVPMIDVEDQESTSRMPLVQGNTDQPIGTPMQLVLGNETYPGEVTGANRWSAQIRNSLEDGEYQVTARITDEFGSSSQAVGILRINASPLASNARAVVPDGVAGEQTMITITLRDGLNRPVEGASSLITLVLTGSNVGQVFSDIIETAPGVYEVSYTPLRAGLDIITIEVASEAVADSPFTSIVTANVVAGLQLSGPQAGQISTELTPFQVRLVDVHGNETTLTTDVVIGLSSTASDVVFAPDTVLTVAAETTAAMFSYLSRLTGPQQISATWLNPLTLQPDANYAAAVHDITLACNDFGRIYGRIVMQQSGAPLSNVLVALLPAGDVGETSVIRITGADGSYNFENIKPGDYVIQVQDENLNMVRSLFVEGDNFYATSVGSCGQIRHDFTYRSADPVIAGMVWYDANTDGEINEWFDANSDQQITLNVPDANGRISFAEWEWIDINGNGRFDTPEDIGEVNRAGFGNVLNPNVVITRPDGIVDSAYVSMQGRWLYLPQLADPFGEYTINLLLDGNLSASADALARTGLVRTFIAANGVSKSGTFAASRFSEPVCTPPSPIVLQVTPEDRFKLDANFSVTCYMLGNVIAEVARTGQLQQQVPITIRIEDVDGNPVRGLARAIRVRINGANASVELASISDRNDGTYTTYYIPQETGEDVVTIYVSDVEIDGSPFTVTISSGIEITSAVLPDAVENQPGYTADLQATGGVQPVTWQVSEGTLPAGLSLDATTGRISGTATNPGDYSFSVTLTDANNVSVQQVVSVRVLPALLRFVLLKQPNSVTEAGYSIGDIHARVENQNGFIADWYTGLVHIAITEGTGGPLAEDATISSGITSLAPVGGVVVFSDLVINRAGTDYSLTLVSDRVGATQTEPFTVVPGPPFSLRVRDASGDSNQIPAGGVASQRVADGISASEMHVLKQSSARLASENGRLNGSRIMLMLSILDEFLNPTVIEEGDTQVALETNSQSGRFFLGQTDTEPVPAVVIPVQRTSTIVFYEDPVTGDPQINGNPTPPAGAREVRPGSEQVRIRTAERLIASPSVIVTEANRRNRVTVQLIDADGNLVNAPFPGVSVTLQTPSQTGRFYTSETSVDPVSTVFITPAVTSIFVYYSDSILGEYTLELNGTGVPVSEALIQVRIQVGDVDYSLSSVVVADGFVNRETPVEIRLQDANRFPVTGRAAQLQLSISTGPNSGAMFTPVVESSTEPGLYLSSYTPQTAGVDGVLVRLSGELFPGAPFTSSVLSDGPAAIAITSGQSQQGTILTALADPMAVRITDVLGNPIPNVTVRYRLEGRPQGSTGAQLSNTEVLTNADGRAAVTFVPGNLVGMYTVRAAVIGLDPVEFTAQAATCALASMDDLAGPCGPYRYDLMVSSTTPNVGQSVLVSAQLTDRHGNKASLEGLELTWNTNREGTFLQGVTNTNASGLSTNVYTPAEIAGVVHRIDARDTGNRIGTAPDVQVVGGALAQFVITGVDTLQVNQNSDTYQIVLRDQFGNEMVAPELLSYRIEIGQSSGLVVLTGNNPQNLTPSALRRVTIEAGSSRGYFRVRQNQAGIKEVRAEQVAGVARVSGVSKPVLFTAGAPTSIQLEGGTNQAGTVKAVLGESLSVQVRDAFGNLVEGAQVTYVITGSPSGSSGFGVFTGANPAAAALSIVAETGSDGIASALMLLGDQIGDYTVEASIAGVGVVLFELQALPDQFALLQNFPNPFNGSTTFRFMVPERSTVTLQIYDSRGRLVETVLNGESMAQGVHHMIWNAHRYANGVYFFRFVARGESGNLFSDSLSLTLMNH
jgi:hypothetical protein